MTEQEYMNTGDLARMMAVDSLLRFCNFHEGENFERRAKMLALLDEITDSLRQKIEIENQ